ncbi:MAG: aconitase/3-isopropylmalate dehydratase large subunit family protein [Fervidicoccaceae archaeon]
MLLRSLALSILSSHSGDRRVEPGDLVVARVDAVLLNDVTGPLALDVLEETGALEARRDRGPRVYVVFDHYAPAHNWDAAKNHRRLRSLSRIWGARLYDVGAGVAHQLLAEGEVRPGELVVGADSHTITYGALASFATGVGSSEAAYAAVTGELWFRAPEPLFVELRGSFGPAVCGKDLALYLLGLLGPEGALYRSIEFFGVSLREMKMHDRLTVSNMMVEAGAKTAMFPLDEELMRYLRELGVHEEWSAELRFEGGSRDISVELGELAPMVAAPPSPTNVKPVEELEGIEVDYVFIGSCTNGRFEDLAAAARLLKGRRVRARLLVIPASARTLSLLSKEGLLDIFLEAGAVIGVPGCGPCFGAHMGVASEGEVVISTANRNFPGRMGPPSARVYLASPLTAAASAVEGRLVDPRRLLR